MKDAARVKYGLPQEQLDAIAMYRGGVPVAPDQIAADALATREVAPIRIAATICAVVLGDDEQVERRPGGGVALILPEGVFAHLLADCRMATRQRPPV